MTVRATAVRLAHSNFLRNRHHFPAVRFIILFRHSAGWSATYRSERRVDALLHDLHKPTEFHLQHVVQQRRERTGGWNGSGLQIGARLGRFASYAATA